MPGVLAMIPRRTRSNPGDEMSRTETAYRNAVWERHQAIGFGATPEKLAPLEAKIATLKAKLEAPKRERKPVERKGPSESEIQRAIMQLLHKHPKVTKVWRQNSGVARKQYGDKVHHVRFNTAHGMSDIMAIMKGSGRVMALEVKSAKGRIAPHQEDFLSSIRAGGGIGAVVRSVDDVVKLLEGV